MDFLIFQDAAYVDIVTAADGALDTITTNNAATVTVWLFGADEQPVDGTVFWFAGTNQRQLLAHVPWSDSIIYFDSAGCDSCLNIREDDPTNFKGQWNHYAFVKDGEDGAIYQNGELLTDATTMPLAAMDVITTARFGTFAANSFPYAGLMDDIGVWDEALSLEQIQQVMTSGLGGSPELPGDFNADGVLDTADFLIMAENFNTRQSPEEAFLKGDMDGNLRIDLRDFIVFRELFHGPDQAAGATAAVPEPATGVLCGIAAAYILTYRRRKSLAPQAAAIGAHAGDSSNRVYKTKIASHV
jgi:hypothetical protein